MDSAYIGIDPGSPLYMAMVSPRGRWVAHAGEDQFAVKAKRGVTNSPEAFVKVLRDWSDYYAKKGVQVEVVIENVGPRP